MLRSINEARKNGSKGVVNAIGLMAMILSALLAALGFMAREGYKDIRGDIAKVQAQAEATHRLAETNCRDIAVMGERLKHVDGECARLEGEIKRGHQ